MQTIEFMPDRLNAEPTVFRGFTTPEMFTAAGAGVVAGLVLSLPFTALAGWVVIPTGALVMPLLVVFFSGKYLVRIKRGKPENFIYRALSLRLARSGLATLPGFRRMTEKGLITVSRGWFLRRSQPVIFLPGGGVR